MGCQAIVFAMSEESVRDIVMMICMTLMTLLWMYLVFKDND